MEPQNLLIIMSDQHSRNLLGCYGNPIVRTPNLDRLAARGTRFTSCWTPSPVCIPARASFATGKYIHQIGFWDNADPYDGSIPSWHTGFATPVTTSYRSESCIFVPTTTTVASPAQSSLCKSSRGKVIFSA